MKILVRLDLAINNESFPSTSGLEFQVTASYTLKFYRHEFVAAINLISCNRT
jgi:hypothetical protein